MGLKVPYSRIKSDWSSSFCLRWCSRYSFTISSVIFPVLQHPKPIAQKCRPQYRLFNSGYSCCNFQELRPFNFLTISLIDCEGRYSICMWTWSFDTTPFYIRMSSASQIWISIGLHRDFISPCSTLYLYFVDQTICTLSQETVCEFKRWRSVIT